MKGICDQCNIAFDVKLKEKRHPKRIIETYFRCPHCKHKYICFVKDEEVRMLQEEIKKVDSPFIRLATQRTINGRMKNLKGAIAK